MKFCKKCASIMKPIEGNLLECISCNHKENITSEDLSATEKMPKKSEIKSGVVDHKNIFATYDFKCGKCNHDKAEVIERQPYITDEDSLTFLKCGKCGFTQQLARKIG